MTAALSQRKAVVSSASKRSKWPIDDEVAINRAVHDYFEGWFQGDIARMKRALHQDLAKRAPAGEDESESLNTDTAQTMIEATANGVGTKHESEKRDFKVDVVDIYRTIANVTVYSGVYREYLGLVRTREGWKIVNALWRLVDENEQGPDGG